MPVEVEFVTLGDAAEKLGTPQPTLRNWVDELEKYNIHYVMRNDRNERIFYDTDLKIFAYMKALKDEHGRRVTTRDIGNTIAEDAERLGLKLRRREDAPRPKPSNRTTDLLGHEDIKQLMQSERVRQFMQIIIDETTKNLGIQLQRQMQEELRAYQEQIKRELEEKYKQSMELQNKIKQELIDYQEQKVNKQNEEIQDIKTQLTRREREDKELMEMIRKLQEQAIAESKKKKGFFAKLFGG